MCGREREYVRACVDTPAACVHSLKFSLSLPKRCLSLSLRLLLHCYVKEECVFYLHSFTFVVVRFFCVCVCVLVSASRNDAKRGFQNKKEKET
jgi:hypothetical protein